jgi:hypothetical protein
MPLIPLRQYAKLINQISLIVNTYHDNFCITADEQPKMHP